jgi:hypothetical protein
MSLPACLLACLSGIEQNECSALFIDLACQGKDIVF